MIFSFFLCIHILVLNTWLVPTFETSTTHDVAHHQRGFDVALQADSLVSQLTSYPFEFIFDSLRLLLLMILLGLLYL